MNSSSIICTYNDTYCISNNHIYVFGKGKDNNIDKDNMHIPRLIKILCDIKLIDCGFNHILCLNFKGSVFSFGANKSRQLGLGKKYDEFSRVYIPQKVDIPPCKQIACGDDFSMCLTEDDLLYSFGSNVCGQLGLGYNAKNKHNSPQLIQDLHNIKYIVCGGLHTICKSYNNTYYGWGANKNGQLGNDEMRNHYTPIICNKYPDNIISIKCGGIHTLLLTLEGKLYSFGDNYNGQLGLNNDYIFGKKMPTLIRGIPEIRRIECGYNYSMCIDVNDYLWLFGGNDEGQLGLGDKNHRYKPILHPTLSNIMDISSRGYSTFIKTLDHKIYAFGCNEYSQLGIQTSKKRQSTPIQVFQGDEDIWHSFVGQSKQKSARK